MFVRGSLRSLTNRGTVARCSSCCCCSARCCRCSSSARRETARSRLSRRGRPSPVRSPSRDVPESPRSLTARGTAARCCCCGCCSARCCRCPWSARRETARSRLSRRGRPSPVLSPPRDVVGVACRRGIVFMFMFVHESPRPVVGSRDCRSQLLPLLLLLLPSRGGSQIGIVAQCAGALAGVILFSWRVTDLRWAWAARRCETRGQPSSHGVGAASSPVCPLIRRPSLCVQASRERSSRDRSRSASRSRDA
jgi:hypothetical protein